MINAINGVLINFNDSQLIHAGSLIMRNNETTLKKSMINDTVHKNNCI